MSETGMVLVRTDINEALRYNILYRRLCTTSKSTLTMFVRLIALRYHPYTVPCCAGEEMISEW